MSKRTVESITAALGRAIREKRNSLGISQEELADRCQLHRTYVADVERGNRNPSLQSLEKIAYGLGIPLSALFRIIERNRDKGEG